MHNKIGEPAAWPTAQPCQILLTHTQALPNPTAPPLLPSLIVLSHPFCLKTSPSVDSRVWVHLGSPTWTE